MIPSFPDFTALELEHRDALNGYFALHSPHVSELTFSNLFSWKKSYGFSICTIFDGFLILSHGGGSPAFFPPLVSREHRKDTVTACCRWLREQGHAGSLIRLDEEFISVFQISVEGSISTLRIRDEQYELTEDRDNFDYLYRTSDLIDYPGPLFHDKKNLLLQFTRNYEYRYLHLDESLLEQCISFEHEWCEERSCETVPGLSKEKCAIYTMLTHYKELGVQGGMLEVGGSLAGLCLGERLNEDTFVLHVEKGKSALKGIYQAMEVEFLRREASQFQFTNKEQDLGNEGLRRSKLSYNPVALVKKYILSCRQKQDN